MAKALTKEELIESLTVPHEGCSEPDQTVFTAEQLAEFTDDQLQDLRVSTKRRRKPRAGGGGGGSRGGASDGTTKPRGRAAYNQTGQVTVPLVITLDEEQRVAFRKAGYGNAASVAEYLAGFISSTSADGVGAAFYVDKDDRPDGCLVVNVDKLVATASNGLAEAAAHQARLTAMRAVFAKFEQVRGLGIEIDDETIKEKMSEGATQAGYTDEQIASVFAEIFD